MELPLLRQLFFALRREGEAGKQKIVQFYHMNFQTKGSKI
jgi:hypothetical protein